MDVSQFVSELNSIIQTSSIKNEIVVPSVPIDPKKKVKILIVSTHVNQVNGYSKVVFNLIKQLAQHPWISIVHFGTQRLVNADLARAYPSTVAVIDATAKEKEKQPGFAFGELPGVIQSERPDIVFIYNDLTTISMYIEQIRKSIENRFFKIWAYLDLTYLAPPQIMIDLLNRDVERIFCFTKAWKEALKAQGMTRPVDVLPHGVDPAMFRPIPRDLARQTLGLPKDMFLFTSVNKNIPRKRLDLLIISFVKLMVRFPMKPIHMLIVADKGDKGGFSLFEIFAREIKLNGGSIEHFGNRLMITSKDTCYRDEDINMLYNCGDVGVSCAEGEGFGLCTFEQMSLGVPQIVPAMNGYNEYCTEENSIMIKPTLRYYIPAAHHSVMGEAQMVNPEDVANAMQRYIFDEDLRKQHGRLAKEKTKEYMWDHCVKVLVKRLHAVQEEEE